MTEITLYWKADDGYGGKRMMKGTAALPTERDGNKVKLTPAVVKCYAGGTTRTFARSHWSTDYHAVEVVRASYVRGSEREC